MQRGVRLKLQVQVVPKERPGPVRHELSGILSLCVYQDWKNSLMRNSQFLGWPTLELRRLQADLIFCYKILFGFVHGRLFFISRAYIYVRPQVIVLSCANDLAVRVRLSSSKSSAKSKSSAIFNERTTAWQTVSPLTSVSCYVNLHAHPVFDVLQLPNAAVVFPFFTWSCSDNNVPLDAPLARTQPTLVPNVVS